MRALPAAVATTIIGASIAVGAAPAAAAGYRDSYEANAGKPARQLRPVGALGRTWQGTGTMIAGDTKLSRGELIHTDRPFDDTGADTIPDTPAAGQQNVFPGLCGSAAAYRHGEFTYPSEPALGRNAADLVELRVAATATSYHVLFQLETLIDPARTVGVLAIDADRNPLTGRPGWAGFEQVLQVHGDVADLNGVPVTAKSDAAGNTLEAVVPRTALGDGTWRVAAATGLWGAGKPEPIVDLAFVTEEITTSFNCWHDQAQSRAIATTVYPTIEVDTNRLRGGGSDPAALQRGPMVRLHVPSIDLGEGTVGQDRYNQTATANIYRGKVQPYATYVPSTYDPDKANPLIVLLHCLTCNHNTFHIAAWPGLRDLAEARGAIIVTPLAYGEGGHYEVEAEQDVFDVLSDVTNRYRIDRERLYLTGMSMGALGTVRLGLIHPDLWARTFAVGVYTTPFCVTPSSKTNACALNYFPLFDNARNLPFGLLNGTLDELTPATGVREMADRLAELRYGYRFWEYPTRRHEPSLHGLTTDVTNPWLGDFRRMVDPAHVTYVLDRNTFDEKRGVVYDRAYWVRDIRLADGVRMGKVDALSGRGVINDVVPFASSGTSAAGPYTARGLDPRPRRIDEGNRITLTTRGVSSLTIRAAEAGLYKQQRLVIDLDADKPVALQIDGYQSLAAPAGKKQYIVEPAAPADRAAAVPPKPVKERLPATGGDAGLAGLGVALVAMGAVLRRARVSRRGR